MTFINALRSKTARVASAIGFPLAMGIAQEPEMKYIGWDNFKAMFGGWAEVSKGQGQGSNIRLYPSFNPTKNTSLSSLIDINKDYPFSKTDLKHNLGNIGPVAVSPVLTYLQDDYSQAIHTGINASYGGQHGFGFAELAGSKDGSTLYTYNALTGRIGSLGLFTQSNVNDFKSTYGEVETTLGSGKKGISPYARVNFTQGQKPTYQAGISVNPGKFKAWMKGKGRN